MNDEKLELTRGWDKAPPHGDEMDHEKVTFHNHYDITLAADLYRPKGARGPLAMIIVSGLFGAVKERSSGLYAQTMAERGFFTLAFDPSYTGELGGAPRYMASPDTNTENFSAAVDHLSCREDVGPEKVGIIGICGWDGIVIDTAALDPRTGVTVASIMYNMSRIATKGYLDEQDSAAMRDPACVRFAAQRTADYRSGFYVRAGGVVDPLPEDVPAFVRDYHDYYKTPRSYHLRPLNSNEGWNVMDTASFPNQSLLAYAGEIRIPVLVVHGEEAHSRYMGEEAFAQLTRENKEFSTAPGTSHTDLYDDGSRDVAPSDRIIEFFRVSLV